MYELLLSYVANLLWISLIGTNIYTGKLIAPGNLRATQVNMANYRIDNMLLLMRMTDDDEFIDDDDGAVNNDEK